MMMMMIMMAMTMAMPPMTDTNDDVNVKFSHHMTTYVNRYNTDSQVFTVV